MDISLVLQAVAVLGGLGLLIGALLAYVGEKMKVQIDPKVEKIFELLPQLNCGACGYAGCELAAEAIAKGEAPPNACLVGGEEELKLIGNLLGLKVEKKLYSDKPVVNCGKGRNEVETQFEYEGLKTCAAVNAMGGDIPCSYGCLGFGDCVRVCPFDAVHIGEKGLPVFDLEKCTRCRLCEKACPRKIISFVPNDAGIYVACSNKDIGKNVREVCNVGCIACKICEKNCPNSAFKVEENLAKVDYDKCQLALVCVEKCPTKCIKQI
ncbi:MAG: RnfABCDGE type electron transport complex subunit B [Actinobacteria bacterium]|nr:RnfABCDGE type electron transport complex subunit B [Actinomycetota bacterium]